MATPPKIPAEQGSLADHGAGPLEDAVPADRRERGTGVQPAQPGDADVNLNAQGRYGNLKQSLTNHWRVQER